MKIRKTLGYMLTVVMVTAVLMIGAAPVAADYDKPTQSGSAITPFQQALQEKIEERAALGLPIPSVSYENTAGSVLNAVGQETTTVSAKTIVHFESPEEAGFETWPNLIIKDIGPDDEGNVFEGGDYTQFVIDRLGMEESDYYTGERSCVYEETITSTANSPQQVTSSAPTSQLVDEILMGATYGDVIDWDWDKTYKAGGFTIFSLTASFDLDWAVGLRLPLRVTLTSPDSVNEGSTFTPTAKIQGVNWNASQFLAAGAPPESGNEFVLRFDAAAGLSLTLVGVDVADLSWSDDLDMSKSFTTPFGPGQYFPIPSVTIPVFAAGIGWAGLNLNLIIDPDVGSEKVTANWQATGDGSGNGAKEFTSTSTVSLGTVAANDYSHSTDYAVVTLKNLKYWISEVLINFKAGITAWVDIEVWGVEIYEDSWDLGPWDLYTLDLSGLIPDMKLGIHPGTLPTTVAKNTLVNNVAPTVYAGPNATVNEGSVFSRSGSFTDPGTDTWSATVNYGDGTVATPLSLSGKNFNLSHVYADNGSYTVTVTVTDDDGGVGTDTFVVTVNNVTPTLYAGADRTVFEGDVISLAPATFNDKGTKDSHAATINWGDGTATEAGTVAESPFGPPGSTGGMNGSVSGSHVYADDGVYTVTVTVTDDDGAAVTDTFVVTVNNATPTLDAGADQTVNEGDVVSLPPATFNDKGTLDSHAATVNWGDGTAIEAGSVTESPYGPPGSTAGMDGTVDGNHVYADDGVYTVTVTVTDDDGATVIDTALVTVNNVAATMDAGADQEVTAAYTVELDPSTYNDKGTLDSHTATIDWGDGTTPDTGSITESPYGPPGSTAGMDGTVDGNHIYPLSSDYTVTVAVTDDNGGSVQDTLTVTVKPYPVSIDIKPGSYPNSINLRSKGVIPVAILTTPEFDATLALPDTMRFGPGEAPPEHYQLEDVDDDGDLDLVLHFRTQLTGIEADAIEASIIGYSYDPLNRLPPPIEVSIKGTDSVRIVPPKGKK